MCQTCVLYRASLFQTPAGSPPRPLGQGCSFARVRSWSARLSWRPGCADGDGPESVLDFAIVKTERLKQIARGDVMSVIGFALQDAPQKIEN